MKSASAFLFVIATMFASIPAQAGPDWQTIVPTEDPFLTDGSRDHLLIDADGELILDRAGRSMAPRCAVPAIPVKDDQGNTHFVPNPFRFFVQPGDPARLIVFHTGGGACWNGLTCASSLGPARGTYNIAPTETAETLQEAGGILDADDPANPFRDWTKVYIPYCTGDVGWGNVETGYTVIGAGGLPASFVISHRGYANIRSVSQWLKAYAQSNGAPDQVLVAGVSGGGYAAIGTLLPEVVDALGDGADYFLIGDSANGVVTDHFLEEAGTSWGFDGTLPGHMLDAVRHGAQWLPVRVYNNTARRYPGLRLGQFQNAFDTVQARVLTIMKFPDDPSAWNNPDRIGESLVEWTGAMRVYTLTSALIPRYRFYTAAGYEHVVLQSIPLAAGFGFCSDEFSTEGSASSLRGQVLLQDWADDMVNRRGRLWRTGEWQNATCFPYCNVPPTCPLQ
ncbi:MAG: hypothetical protein H6945_14495 [Zoogloeaceae bacterium]|nr:hypothetical protein [Rhodocyclaceae bacterium]MCP5236941.1 hypothetical protein [Zoogloeaceae bacterium]